MRTLEILIPTYGRPQSAAGAIQSVLESPDQRIGIRCNSNGFEPTLERYRQFDPRLVYESFDKNKGVHANFLHLLSVSNAEFCMLLSDEDRLDPEGIPAFLDFLENINSCVSVVSCSVFDLSQNRFYFLPHERYKNTICDINLYAAFGLVPGYMSGLVFRTENLRCLNLGQLMRPVPANAYCHLDITLKLLINSKLRFYIPKLVLKGKEIEFGGDGYSHRFKGRTAGRNNHDLNPEIYGPYARIRQFYYQWAQILSVQSSLRRISYFLAVTRNTLDFTKAVRDSKNVVFLSSDTTLRREIQRGLADSFREGQNGRSFISQIFSFAVLSPPFIFNPAFIFFRLVFRVLGRLYAEAMIKSMKARCK